jgi:hypothetical protein
MDIVMASIDKKPLVECSKGARPRAFPLFSSRNIAIARKLVRNCGGGSPLVHERLRGESTCRHRHDIDIAGLCEEHVTTLQLWLLNLNCIFHSKPATLALAKFEFCMQATCYTFPAAVTKSL